MKKDIGLIGLGYIGKYFTGRLLDAGYPLKVLDIDKESMDYAVDLGAKTSKTSGEMAQEVDIIVLALPGHKPVEDVMEGTDGILNNVGKVQLIIDTGTTKAETDIHYEKVLSKKGVGFLDSPITWKSDGLILMVGGTKENFEKGEDVIDCLSYKYKHIGEIGRGQLLKSVNQMISSNQIAIYAEAVEYGKKLGLGKDLVKDFLEFPIPGKLYEDDFSRSVGNVELNYKDLGYILDLAHDSMANIPLTSLVHDIFKETVACGGANWTQAGIVQYWRKLNNRE